MTELSGTDAIGAKPVSWAWRAAFATDGFHVLVKLCCGLSLLLVLSLWFDISSVVRKLLAIDTRFLAIALLLLALQFALACMRWIYIVERQHLPITSRRALSVFGFGTLANLFLVTSIAGMSVRVALMVRGGARMPDALASVAAERAAAAAGLAACAAFGFAFGLPELQRHFGRALEFRVDIVALAIFAGLALISVVALRKVAALRQFSATLWRAFSSVRVTALLIFVSAASVLLGFASLATLALGMGLTIDPGFFFSVMPAIAFVSALPISFGGWGVREGAMVAGLTLFSVPADSAVALSISYGLGGLLVALLLGAALAFLGNAAARGKLEQAIA